MNQPSNLIMIFLLENSWSRIPLDKLKNMLNATTLLIRRPGDEEVETSNHADEKVFEYEYDWTINNDGDLDLLRVKAQIFVNSLFS